jgi:hypothetical protein
MWLVGLLSALPPGIWQPAFVQLAMKPVWSGLIVSAQLVVLVWQLSHCAAVVTCVGGFICAFCDK